jgi:hypothetical protein
MAGLTQHQRWRIRNVFLSARRDSYGGRDAGRRLGVPASAFRDRRITWTELVEIALEQWTLEEIEEALGEDYSLPRLLTLARLTVKLPAYQLALLHHLAGAQGLTVDEWLRRHLQAVAREHEPTIEGYAEARNFPRSGGIERV